MASILTLEAELIDNAVTALVPHIDGMSLVALVAGYETERGFEPAGSYSGIIPAYFSFGDLALYYEARESPQWPRPDHAWLLGCDCGEVGCWPLTARITITGDSVIWSHFQQGHRPGWDYTGFGPFIFDRDQYAQAVADGKHALASEAPVMPR